MKFFYWLGQIIRWSLVVMSLYLAIVWQGHEPPVIDISKIQISEGKYGCPSPSGSRPNRSPSGIDGITYKAGFGFVAGSQGGAIGCPDLQGRTTVVWWLPIYEGRQRLLLQVMDKEKQQIYGNTKEQNLRRYLYDVQDRYGLYFTKFGLFLLALGLIFRKQSDVFLNFLRGKSNG
jgi:hypothetical protein